MFTELALREPRNPVARLYLIGCGIRRRDTKAIAAARESLRRLVPGQAGGHGMAGDWLAAAGYCREAEEEYGHALPSKTPGTAEFALAQCNQKVGNIDAALGQYRKALELNPELEERHLHLAFLLIGIGESVEAGKVLVEASRRFPEAVRIIVTMSLLHLELGYPDRARIGYEKARVLAPDTPIVWKLLGRIQTAEGTTEEAIKSFEHAAALDPKDAQTFVFMGMAQTKLPDSSDKALADFLRAIELDPGLMEARFQAAIIYLNSKEEPLKAARELERVVKAAPDFARAHQLLIQAYQRLGWREKAAAEAEAFRRQWSPPAQGTPAPTPHP